MTYYSINELSKITKISRMAITKYTTNKDYFKKIIIKNQVKYSSDLNLEQIKNVFLEQKRKSKQRFGNKNALGKRKTKQTQKNT